MPPDRLNLKEELHNVVALHLSLFLDKEDIAQLGIGPGEDIFMVGRFVDHDGAASNVPSVRFGNISVMPQPVKQPTGAKLESFVLDVHSRTGYSGSPVFVYRTFGSDLTSDQMISVSNHIFTGSFQAHPDDHFVKLLGLHWGQFPEQWEIKSKRATAIDQALKQADSRYVEGMSGMTLAIPAWAIKEFLDMPKFRAPRNKRIGEINEWAAENRGPVAESASDGDANPDHLEDFNRLVDAAARKRPQGDPQ